MLHIVKVAAMLCVVKPLAILADRSYGAMQPDMDTTGTSLRELTLQEQILRNQMSLGATGLAPSFAELGSTRSTAAWPEAEDQMWRMREAALQPRMNQEGLAQQYATLSHQLELASEGLALQRRLAALQMEQAGMTPQRMMGDLQRPASPVARPASFLSLGSKTHARQLLPDSIALPQVAVERLKNPALAALLLEPAIYGYSVIVWALVVVLTGISSAFCTCMCMGKMPCGRALPAEQQPPPGPQRNGLSSYFEYPGSFIKERNANSASCSQGPMLKEPEEDAPGVETWTRVPARHASRMTLEGDCSRGYVDEC